MAYVRFDARVLVRVQEATVFTQIDFYGQIF